MRLLHELLHDDRLPAEELQALISDDAGGRMAARLERQAVNDTPPPSVTELRDAALHLAKQGYLEHSKNIRYSRHNAKLQAAKQPQRASSTANNLPPSPSAFPALSASTRPPPAATPTAATPTSSWAAAAGPTPSHGAAAPSPASVSGPTPPPAPTPNGGRLQGAWAQGSMGSMSQKKQAALDERMRGRTPPGHAHAHAHPHAQQQAPQRQQPQPHGESPAPSVGGAWAAGSPAASVGSTAGGGGGRGGTPGAWGAANGLSRQGQPPTPPTQQSQGAAQSQSQGGVKRIVPKPVAQQQQQQQQQPTSAGPSPAAWPAARSVGATPASAAGGGGAAAPGHSPAVSVNSAQNPWGVAPVQTSRREAPRQQQSQQQPAPAVANGTNGEEPDPTTPCSAIVSAAPGAVQPGGGAAAASPGPITPLNQTVPALEPHIPYDADGVASVSASISLSAISGRAVQGGQPGDSPPSVSSFPKSRAKEPGAAGAAASAGASAEGPAACGARDGERTDGVAGEVVAGATAMALGPAWCAAHERLAALHAGVLCGGHVACLQDDVADLLYLLACPPELLLAPADANAAAAAASTPSAAAAAAATPGAGGGGGASWSLATSVRYACAVLARCGGLLSGLGHRLLAAVAACAAARLAAPTLAEAAEAAAQRRERSLARSRAVDALGGQRLQLVGPMLQSGSDMAAGKSRSQEQQRRVSNRERCRDMFFATVRQAAGAINRDGGGDACPVSGSGSSIAEQMVPLRAQVGEVLAALHPDNLPFFAELFTGCVLQAAATGESLVEGDLASLASRNPSRFQRLNQRMQQPATPGQLQTQPSPQSLSGARPGRSTPTAAGDGGAWGAAFSGGGGGGTIRILISGGTAGPSNGGGGSSSFAGSRGGGYGGGAYGGGAAGGMAGDGGQSQPRDTYGVTARCAAILARLSTFPPPQRPYVFFLEAADSASLLVAVSRHMAGALQALLCKALGGPSPAAGSAGAAAAASLGPLGDHVVASGTLASYLAYLAAVHGAVRYGVSLPMPQRHLAQQHDQEVEKRGGATVPCNCGTDPRVASTPRLQAPRHPPLDVLQLLCVADERGALVQVVPCIAQYLYFLTHGARLGNASGPDGGADGSGADGGGGGAADAAALPLPQLCAIARWLRELLAAPPLQPQQAAFGAAALCLRSAAEEALAHAVSAGAGVAAGDAGCPAAAAAGAEEGSCQDKKRDARLARSLQESDGLVDIRLMELCCPAIEEASRMLQHAAALATKMQGKGGGGRTPAGAVSPGGAGGGEARPLPPRRVPPAALVRLGGGGATGGSGSAAIPESVAAVLSAPGPSPLSAALAQALLGQYSTGEHALPMRDVVSYVTGVLAVNGAAAALEVIVPKVASEQLSALAEAARPVLRERLRRWQDEATTAAPSQARGSSADGAAVATAALPLPLAEALTATASLAEAASAAASRCSLEAALPAVRRQLGENALKSLQALLPGTVPEEAVAAAAALAAQSAEVACLQRLVAHVPAAVRQHVDEQVKHVVREVLREVERAPAEARLTDGEGGAEVGPKAEAPEALEAVVNDEGTGGGVDGTAAGGKGRGISGADSAGALSTAAVEGSSAGNEDGRGASGKGVPPSAASVAETAAAAMAEAPGAPDAAHAETKVAAREKAAAAVEVGRRLAAALVELAADVTDPSVEELVQLTVRHLGSSAASAPLVPSDGDANTKPPAAAAGVTPAVEGEGVMADARAALKSAAAGQLYDSVRSGALDSAVLERLLIRCLRAASATAVAAGATATVAPWGVQPPAAAGGGEAAALTLLAEVALAVVQCHADAAAGWADAVWTPDGDAAAARTDCSLPPMLTNVCHQLAAYARDVESYAMLKALRLALQRITMGSFGLNASREG